MELELALMEIVGFPITDTVIVSVVAQVPSFPVTE
jgi:hypothetical protein